MHLGIGAAAVAVLGPILCSQGGEVDGSPAQCGQIQQRPPCIAIREILQDVVTDHEVVGCARREVDDRPRGPSIALAQILTGLEAGITRARQRRRERAAQQADAAAGIEDPADRDGGMAQYRGDQHGAHTHLGGCRDPGLRIEVELAEVRG